MANLTIAVDDDLLKRARLLALENGTSVNALLRDYLKSYVGHDKMAARLAFVELADRIQVDGGRHTWTRDELHERG